MEHSLPTLSRAGRGLSAQPRPAVGTGGIKLFISVQNPQGGEAALMFGGASWAG